MLTVTPAASALATGAGSPGLDEAEKAGWDPSYSQFWVGEWMNTYGWGGLESALSRADAHNAVPLIEWYYWGDSISKNCVKYGCDGKNRGEWNAMAKTLAQKIGHRKAVVVLETEFNKGDVQNWYGFNHELKNQIQIFRTYAPNTKIVIGFGHWGSSDWGTFSDAVSKSDGVGFEVLRATTRNSGTEVERAADFALETAQKMKSKFNKPVYLHDVDISSYGGEWRQEKAVKRFYDLRQSFLEADVEVIIWRDVRDSNKYTYGDYFQAAEFHWGLLRADGSKKPAWDDWVRFAKAMETSGSGSGSGDSSSTTQSTSSGSLSVDFTNVKGNNWWVQANVQSNKDIVEVKFKMDGVWWTMQDQGWGWARSKHVPDGKQIQFRATAADGSRAYSGFYTWPDATSSGSGSTTTSTSSDSGLSASFSPKGNNWWVQTGVQSNKDIVEVKFKMDGVWWKMDDQGWGWTRSKHVPDGKQIQFRATAADGSRAYSGIYTWPE